MRISILTVSLILGSAVGKTQQVFTYLSRSAPYGSNKSQLCLDAALATAVFEQKVNYVFLDDGVYQLLKEQDADAIKTKTIGRAFQALDLYGIKDIYVKEDSLLERNLKAEDLVIEVHLLDNKKLANLLENSDNIINL